MGQLLQEDQYYLVENFMVIFNCDYCCIVELYVQVCWMLDNVCIDDLEVVVCLVCELYFICLLLQILLVEVLMKLFCVVQCYQLILQLQLILLQKILLNIEGVGCQLDLQIDIWVVVKLVLVKILCECYSLCWVVCEIGKWLLEIMIYVLDMLCLVYVWLIQQVEGCYELVMCLCDLVVLDVSVQCLQKCVVGVIIGVGLLVIVVLMYVLQLLGWYWGDLLMWSWVFGVVGVVVLVCVWWC